MATVFLFIFNNEPILPPIDGTGGFPRLFLQIELV